MKELFKPTRLPMSTSTGLFLVRLIAGLAFMYHGYGKIQNPMGWMGPDATIPGVFQLLAALAEFGGGLAWIVGFLTPLASLGIAITMGVAIYFHAAILGDPFVASAAGSGSYEPALLYLSIAFLFLFAGPGKFSLDRLLFGEKN
ncbi:DoxX [Candidatus Rubidus massiliensis]|nr:DoxX [Candidatus Rubidus massiliensis]